MFLLIIFHNYPFFKKKFYSFLNKVQSLISIIKNVNSPFKAAAEANLWWVPGEADDLPGPAHLRHGGRLAGGH